MSAARDAAGVEWAGTDALPAQNGHRPTEQHERPPPSDPGAERAVLGAAILRPDLIPELAAILRDNDFYRPAHETIWRTVVDLSATGQPIDELTVWAALSHDQDLKRAGGALTLHACVEDVPTPASGTYYAQIVADLAQDRRDAQMGTWLVQSAYGGLEQELRRERLEKHLADRNPAAKTAASTWAPVDLAAVLDGTAPDTQPALMPRTDGHALLYPGAVHTLSGEPTSGKTWIALHALLAEIQAGHDVALIDFEDRASTATARLLALGATPDQLRAHLRYVRPEIALDTTGRGALGLAVTGTTLAVVDGVTEAMTMHGLDLSSNPDVATFYALLPRHIANLGPTVVLIDHVVKDSEKQGRWSIGGQHKVAGLDGAAYTVKNVEPMGRGRRGTSRVFIAKDRHGHVEEHALGRCAAEFHLDSTDPNVSVARLDPPEAMPTTESGDMRPTFLMERVSKWLEINPDSTGAAIDQAKLGKVKYVRDAVRTLVAEGFVTTQPGARGAVHHSSIEPFRRDQEPDDDPFI